MLGQALPCIEGCHACCPGGVHAHGVHARGAQQPPHASRVHAARDARSPRTSMLQELAVKSLPGPHLGREERSHSAPPPLWMLPSCPMAPHHPPNPSSCYVHVPTPRPRLPYWSLPSRPAHVGCTGEAAGPHRSVLAQLLALLLLEGSHGGRGSGRGSGRSSSHRSRRCRLSKIGGGSRGV